MRPLAGGDLYPQEKKTPRLRFHERALQLALDPTVRKLP